MISLSDIHNNSSSRSYTRGRQIYISQKVHELVLNSYQPGVSVVEAHVDGSGFHTYDTFLSYDHENDCIIDYGCTCPAIDSYEGMCKHCVALALTYYGIEAGGGSLPSKPKSSTIHAPQLRTDPQIERILYGKSMENKARYFQPSVTGEVDLLPLFEYDTYKGWQLNFKIGGEHKYILKDISEFVEHLKKREKYTYGKKLSFIHERSAFTRRALFWIEYLEMRVSIDRASSPFGDFSYYRTYSSSIKRYLPLNDLELTELFYKLGQTSITLTESHRTKTISICQENPAIELTLEAESDGYQLILPPMDVYQGNKKLCVRVDNTIYCCTEDFLFSMGELLALSGDTYETVYDIGKDDMKTFCQVLLPDLEHFAEIKKPDDVEVFIPEPCEVKIYLDDQNDQITGYIKACYGDTEFNLLAPISVENMYRDVAMESKALSTAREYFTHNQKDDYLYIENAEEDAIYQLVSTGITQLQQTGEVYVSDAIKRMQIMHQPKLRVGVSLKAGLLDLSIQSDGLSADEIEGILANYRRRKKYYRLPSGEFLQLEDSGITALAELADGLELNAGQLTSGHLQIPEYRAFYLDQVLREHDAELSVKREQEFKAMIRNLKDVGDSDYEVPDELQAELRPYQKFGYRWLCTLAQMGFGGILADDMGLGKTIQIITFLLARKKQEKIHALIICPASLVYNWESEIQRFAPSLSVIPVVGNMEERKNLIQQEADIMLTSYDLLKRDILEYENHTYDYMIIDEAQNIKNHTTQAAKAVKGIHSRIRFALTGTPIENTLSELWSIFDFLMPGVLKSYKNFKNDYEMPIVSTQDETTSKRLQKMIRPFILRRLKKDVLKELPDKLEEVVYSKMDSVQRELYEANAKKVSQSLAKKTAAEFKQGKFQILAELTKLRQICCDPSLVYEDYKGESAKVETCMSLISGAVEAGNKVLLFSQFTSMLSIIEGRLKTEKIAYYSLTGSTSKEKRKELVNAYQTDDTPVFLISLKAGGTGLNLTAANVVIHFDPWWNLAAQNQATDRAHRIGQEQIVTVYKLITKNTLEEKILKLQEKKASLSDQIIANGSITDSLASKEDFLEILQV